MRSKSTVTARMGWGFAMTAVAVMSGGAAWAADPPPAAPLAQADTAAPPPPPAPPPPAPAPAAPPVAAVPPAAAVPPPAETPTVTAAPTPPPADFKKINVGVAMRVGGVFQSVTNTASLSDTSLDEIYVEPRFSGDIAPMFAWQANFQGAIPTAGMPGSNGSGTAGVSASILDLIAKFEPAAAFHLWAGRMLVPSDRSNFSGPWFMSPWKYPGLYASPLIGMFGPVGPKEGPQGRNNGATVWGEFLGAKLKYYAGVFDLNDAAVSPLFSGRVNICLLGSESGFYHSSTYYGAQDIVAIGLGAQYQKNAEVNVSDPTGATLANLSNQMADLLAEKNFGPGGVGTFEAQYYHFDANNVFGRKHAYYVLASWLTPNKIGVGKLQPLIRWQQATAQSVAGVTPPSWKNFDAYLTYVIDDYFLRIAAGYSHGDVGTDPKSNAVYLGVQMQR
jgi:hypothetical protein